MGWEGVLDEGWRMDTLTGIRAVYAGVYTLSWITSLLSDSPR